MVISKIANWFSNLTQSSAASPERISKIKAILKTLDHLVKPAGMDDQQFYDLKYGVALVSKENIDSLTENFEEIYSFKIIPRCYRETAIKKYLLKIATVTEFSAYLKMAVISYTNPKFDSSLWISNDYLNLLDALATGDMAFATKFAQEYMRYISFDYVNNYPELMFYATMHMLLKSFVLQKMEDFNFWLQHLIDAIKNMPECYEALPKIFESLVSKNNKKFEIYLLAFTIGHAEIFKINKFGETSKGDVACCLSDKYLFIWAISFLNLARFNGMNVKITHELVPEELLIPIKSHS